MAIKRYILSTSVCLLGGAIFIFCLAIVWTQLIQPDLKRPSDLTVPNWIRHLVSFIFVFSAIHFSSYLSPRGSRQHSALISGVAVTILFFGCIALFLHRLRPSFFVPILLDFNPIGCAIIFSWLLHAHKSA